MLHKRNLIAIAVGSVFLLTFGTTSVSASDSVKEGDHQHSSGQAAGQKSDDHHSHQCHQKMSSVDLNKDGKISKEEFMKHHEAMFDKKDSNKDGFLDESEMHGMMDHMHQHAQDQKKDSADSAHKH